jgi:hypothetical protein
MTRSSLIPIFALLVFSIGGFAADSKEQQLVDEVTNYDFAPQACLTEAGEREWAQRSNQILESGSPQLNAFLSKKLDVLLNIQIPIQCAFGDAHAYLAHQN